jgi:D-cysteine desulfhydrase
VSVDKDNLERAAYEEEVTQIANECAHYIGSDVRLARQDIKVIYGYTGEGYGMVSNLEREAIRLMARCEGSFLDPVYTGRAFGALADLIRKGAFKRGETVLFWHTGGAPALFAYAKELV